MKSIGIVTFNASQKNLIEKKLEENVLKNRTLARAAADQPEPLFVKSLENVQGDERDVILFSVGYGMDRRGRSRSTSARSIRTVAGAASTWLYLVHAARCTYSPRSSPSRSWRAASSPGASPTSRPS